MFKIKMDKTFTFMVEDLAFGSLSKEEIIELFKDGRFVSPFLERQLTIWFPELTHVSGCKPYDHLDEHSNKYDAKNFTKNGLKFMPSGMIGTGRKYNYELCRQKIKKNKMTYIACDVVDFPQVRVKFVDGIKLLGKYKSAQVPTKDRELLFG